MVGCVASVPGVVVGRLCGVWGGGWLMFDGGWMVGGGWLFIWKR